MTTTRKRSSSRSTAKPAAGNRNKVRTVMHEFRVGKLRSGSKTGPKVKNRKQAIAIALNEARRKKGD